MRYEVIIRCKIEFQHHAKSLVLRRLEDYIFRRGTDGKVSFFDSLLPKAAPDRQFVTGARIE